MLFSARFIRCFFEKSTSKECKGRHFFCADNNIHSFRGSVSLIHIVYPSVRSVTKLFLNPLHAHNLVDTIVDHSFANFPC